MRQPTLQPLLWPMQQMLTTTPSTLLSPMPAVPGSDNTVAAAASVIGVTGSAAAAANAESAMECCTRCPDAPPELAAVPVSKSDTVRRARCTAALQHWSFTASSHGGTLAKPALASEKVTSFPYLRSCAPPAPLTLTHPLSLSHTHTCTFPLQHRCATRSPFHRVALPHVFPMSSRLPYNPSPSPLPSLHLPPPLAPPSRPRWWLHMMYLRIRVCGIAWVCCNFRQSR